MQKKVSGKTYLYALCVFHAKLQAKHFMCITHWIFTLALWARKHCRGEKYAIGEVKQFAQGHLANKQWSQHLDLGSLAFKSMNFRSPVSSTLYYTTKTRTNR